MSPTATTTRSKTSVLDELHALEADLQAATAERNQLSRDHTERYHALNGAPNERHIGGLVEELRRLYKREPRMFNADGVPVDPDSPAGKLAAKIDQLAAPMGDIQLKVEHAGRIVNRCQQDLDEFINAHFEEIVEAMRPEAERLAAETNAAARVFSSQLAEYLGFYGRLHGICAVWSKRPGAPPVARNIQGGTAAQEFKRVADSVNLPAPILEP